MSTQKEEGLNPLAVVTGASSGIGYELAHVFAKNGYDLIIAAEDQKIEHVARALRDLGTQIDCVQADLSTYEGVEKLYKQIQSSQRPLDAIALNAGVGVSGEFENTELERELELLNLNIVSVVHLTKRILPMMLSQGHGKILYTSSVAADMPGPYYAVYAASKSFVQSFAEAIRVEVKDKGITVTSLQPGPTDTEFFERADMMDTKAGVGKKDDPADVAQDGFDALMAGKDHVVAGSLMNKVQSVLGKIIPESQGAKIHAQQTKPGSAHH